VSVETAAVDATVAYTLRRVGVIMTPDLTNPDEIDGVLNPATGRDRDGDLYLLPRLVASGNVSRVGLARVLVTDGVPMGVERLGVVLAPDAGWERATGHAGVEDPRVTWFSALGLHVMTYVAYGPLGPRSAVAVSDDLRTWKRLGPIHFQYQEDLDTDLNLFCNKDMVFFPRPVPGPGGRPCFAALHRPMWDLDLVAAGAMILSADDPSVLLARTSAPLLSAQIEQERTGIVPNVVFPTAIEDIDGQLFVFYGMADSRIGVAALDRTEAPS
jgi:predicted GH43/DUF377 family glycosyl hydrolase